MKGMVLLHQNMKDGEGRFSYIDIKNGSSGAPQRISGRGNDSHVVP